MADSPTEENLLFSFGTDGIPAKELVKILEESRFTFREIAKASETEEVELKIYPFKQGSFEYVVAVAAIAAPLFGVFREILSYKKARLEYETAKRKENLLIETKQQLKPPQPPAELQANPGINIHINAMLKVAGENSSSFFCADTKKEDQGVFLSNHDIHNILEIEKQKNKEKPKRQTIEKFGTLSLVKTSTKKFGMWEFIYDDVRIMAQVPENVKKAAQITSYPAGTKMTVLLSIRQEYDTLAKAWENISYRIVFVDKIEKL